MTLLDCLSNKLGEVSVSKALKLSVLCHGRTMDRRSVRFPADEPLLPEEHQNTRELEALVSRSTPCLVAPEIRARQTAEALGREFLVEPRLKDVDYGKWAGRTIAEIGSTQPDALGIWLSNPGAAPHEGESICELIQRVSGWMADIFCHRGEMLVVTHPSVIRAMVLNILEAPASAFWKIDVQDRSITDIRHDGRRWALRSLSARY